MRTLEDYTRAVEVSPNGSFGLIAKVEVKYNRHQYEFKSDNWRALQRIRRQGSVNNKAHLYGYSLKGAYEAFYKEFAKLHKFHSDKLTEIIR